MPDVPLHGRRSASARWALRIGLLVLAAAITLSIASFGRLREGLSSLWKRAPLVDDTVEVIVAKETVPAYTVVTANKLLVARRKKDLLPAGVIHHARDVVNRVTVQELLPNEPIVQDWLAPAGSPAGITSVLKPGWGTVSFETSRVGGPIRLLQRGAAVAVLATWDPPAGKEGAVPLTSILCQGALVVMPLPAANPEAKHSGMEQITLQMPADDVVKVTEAAGRARLTLVALPRLPGPADPKLQGSTLRPHADMTPYIEVIRGSQSSMQGPSPAERRRLVDEPIESPKEENQDPKEGDK